MERAKWVIRLAYAQGIYYLITGLWPILDIGTFQIATGPKIDLWLVRTVGALVTCTGAILFFAARAREVQRPIALLSMANAAALLFVDVVYVSLHVIAHVYLIDAVIQCLLIVGWALCFPASKYSGEPLPLNRFDREADSENY